MQLRLQTATLAVALLASAPLAPQRQTWTVDITGGGQFTDIESAVRAANDGDVIAVRPGQYPGFSVWKGVSILAEPGTSLQNVSPNLSIVGLPADRDLTIFGLTWDAALSTPITIQDSEGRITIESCSIGAGSGPLDFPGIRVLRSRQVTISECTIVGGPGIYAEDARVSINDSTVTGHAVFPFGNRVPAQPGIILERATLGLAQCVIQGGDGTVANGEPPAAGIAARDGVMTIAGDTNARVDSGTNSITPFPAIFGIRGTLDIDPSVALSSNAGSTDIFGSVVVNTTRIPSLSGRSAVQGGNLQLTLFSPQGEAFALLMTLPGDVISLPGFGDFWFNFGFPLLTIGQGTQDASEHYDRSLPLSSNPAVRGFSLTVQAIASVGGGTLRTSNPFTFVLR